MDVVPEFEDSLGATFACRDAAKKCDSNILGTQRHDSARRDVASLRARSASEGLLFTFECHDSADLIVGVH